MRLPTIERKLGFPVKWSAFTFALLSALVVGLLARAAVAVPPATSEPREIHLNDIPGMPHWLSLDVDHRTRYEFLDNQFRAGRPGSDQIFALRTRIRADVRIAEWLNLGAEFQDSRAYLADDNTRVGTGLVNASELLAAYAEVAFGGPLGRSHTIQGGRFTLDLGSRRLVARNRYRNTSNAFTGLMWSWLGREHDLRVFWLLPVQRLPSDRDRLVDNDIEFDGDSTDFQFFGLFYEDALPWKDHIEVYAFGLYEEGVYDASDGDQLALRRLGTTGFRLLREPSPGRFDYQLETAFQFGSSQDLTISDARLDHFAHFHHLTLGYTFDAPGSPRVLLHYDYASGDDDPFDDDNGRFDTLYGARRFEYGPTSIYGAFARSNINTPGVRLQLQAGLEWSGFLDYRAVWLASDRDEWVGTDVRDLTGDSGSFVGSQIEFRVRWRPFPSNVLLELGYAHLFAGRFIDEAPNSNGGDTNYVYTQIRIDL